jgi:hypothetical protein
MPTSCKLYEVVSFKKALALEEARTFFQKEKSTERFCTGIKNGMKT